LNEITVEENKRRNVVIKKTSVRGSVVSYRAVKCGLFIFKSLMTTFMFLLFPCYFLLKGKGRNETRKNTICCTDAA
jgi:hypothetical protein